MIFTLDLGTPSTFILADIELVQLDNKLGADCMEIKQLLESL